MPPREINDSEVAETLVRKYGARQVIEHYVDSLSSHVQLAESLFKDQNVHGGVLEIGRASEALRTLRGVLRDPDLADHIKQAAKEIESEDNNPRSPSGPKPVHKRQSGK